MPPCNRYRKEQLVRQSIKRKWVSAQVEAISQPAVEQRGIAEEGGGLFETVGGRLVVALIVVGLGP